MDEGAEPRQSFSGRAFTSLFTAWAFTITSLAGIATCLAPPVQLAESVSWSLLGLARRDWTALLVVGGWALALGCGFHLFYNFRQFAGHIKTKGKRFPLRGEFILATAIAIFIAVSVIWRLPPLAYLAELGGGL